jgi:hypothetical protein
MSGNSTKTVRVYDPVLATSSNVPIDAPDLWPSVESKSTHVAGLKADLVEWNQVSTKTFELIVQREAGWMVAKEDAPLPDKDVVYVRVAPHAAATNASSWSFWSNMPFGAFHTAIQGALAGLCQTCPLFCRNKRMNDVIKSNAQTHACFVGQPHTADELNTKKRT